MHKHGDDANVEINYCFQLRHFSGQSRWFKLRKRGIRDGFNKNTWTATFRQHVPVWRRSARNHSGRANPDHQHRRQQLER